MQLQTAAETIIVQQLSCDDDVIIVFLHIGHVFFLLNHVIKARDGEIYSRSKIIQQSYSKSYTNHTPLRIDVNSVNSTMYYCPYNKSR